VDDDPVNLIAMDHMLKALGHEPVGVASGPEALARMKRQAFDMLLCDIHMPVMDGVELLSRARALPHALDMPIVAVTADVMTRTAGVYRELGFAGVIAKPLLIAPLVEVLEAASRPPERRVFASRGIAKG
jgi:CheY-like chemotaxis protein